MKRILILAIVVLASCKPEVYLGPLESPVGNWRSSESIYYFNGEIVGQNNSCEYSAISFYKDSLCCMEGVKGAFAYHMSETGDSLIVDSLAWHIEELTGRFMKLEYLEDFRTGGTVIDTEESEEEFIQTPLEYKGKTIVSDGKGGYMYTGTDGKDIPCRYYEHTEEDGTQIIDWWFDSRHDTYKPF